MTTALVVGVGLVILFVILCESIHKGDSDIHREWCEGIRRRDIMQKHQQEQVLGGDTAHSVNTLKEGR
jgi:hypothetical protein